jgi:hypothetical protein
MEPERLTVHASAFYTISTSSIGVMESNEINCDLMYSSLDLGNEWACTHYPLKVIAKLALLGWGRIARSPMLTGPNQNIQLGVIKCFELGVTLSTREQTHTRRQYLI